MKTILNFIDVWGNRIVFFLLIIVFFKTCTTNGRIDKITKKVDNLEVNTPKNIDDLELKMTKEIKIEGLKSEKRMIQSTNRKIMDVNRQTEIDKEISKITND
jgi:hypothetical protein